MEYENDDTPVNLHSINEMLPEFIEKEKTNVMVRDDNELLSYIMIGRNKASDLSFFTIFTKDSMEMRMFSLDSLLFEKPNPTGEVIVSELTRFILYTENLMMNVIKALNQAYSKTGASDIKPSQRKMLEDTLLGKRPNPAQVKKIGRRLFSTDSVDLSTSRSLRSPVGLPGKSLKSQKTFKTYSIC